ncbi:helix-turn-helix domain-containing protein [Carboxylicivirga sp. 1411-1]|uniref:helix-turn-helix domain-containing protein n=1 Tax=Carboxylicivirga sp. 1411-1 TaxID=3417573 RepID=UPI003D3300DE
MLIARVNNLVNARQKLREHYSKKVTIEPSELEATHHEEEFLQKVIKHIEDNLQNPLFSAKTLATNLNMSQPSLYRKLKALTGLSIAEFIRSIRIKRAAQLIVLKKYTITEISELIGFSDTAYFRKCFVKEFGITPSEYSKTHG